jgi:hypothetical protein
MTNLIPSFSARCPILASTSTPSSAGFQVKNKNLRVILKIRRKRILL